MPQIIEYESGYIVSIRNEIIIEVAIFMKDLKSIFEERRSVNFFDSNKKIDDYTLRNIINLASYAPSAFNLQPWEVIIVKSDEYKKKLYEEACNQPKIIQAPITLIIIGDKKGYLRKNPIWDEKIRLGLSEEKVEGIIKYSEKNLYPTEEKKASYAARNSSLFAMSLMYSAKYYGVDSHPMIGFNEEKVKEIFNIEENKIVTMMISLGYFDEEHELKPREKRLKYDDIVKEY